MSGIQAWIKKQWKRFSAWFTALSRRTKIIGGVVLAVLIVGLLVLLHGNSPASSSNALPTVTLESVADIGGNTNGVSVLGTVQSVSQADILAQSGGTVESIHTTLGATVPAGFVIANLDSSAASAAVLQAQGGYDAALAAQKATGLQSQNSTQTFVEEQNSVRNLYTSTYTSLESTLIDNVDSFFGAAGPVGPELLISPLYTGDELPRGRAAITVLMNTWQASIPTASSADPLTLLSQAQSTLDTVSTFLTMLEDLANQKAAGATPTQLQNLATAQSAVAGLIANISAARTAYNTQQTAAEVGTTQSANTSADVTSSEAAVEEALGGLRAAQAAYEKTVIRAPIAGTVNYLPIHVGDNVTVNQRVATVARNNALEVVMHLSEGDRDRIAVGDTLTIENTYKGIVTTIAPALDPVTQQIEVDIAVNDGANLVNGQSVQVNLPSLPSAGSSSSAATSATIAASTSTNASSTPSTIELPLAAVKLMPNERDVFTVDSTGHLVAHPVTIGQVIGDRIQITSPLDPSLNIVLDARGLSAGDAVLVASSTPSDTTSLDDTSSSSQ